MDKFVAPPDHAQRVEQARKRAEWDIGDASWADVILGAYMDPEWDAEHLEMESES